MISIIIPVYNVEDKIQKCICSILQQTYTDWELLLVDDGSSDSSGEICDEYSQVDIRIRVFHKENGGVSSARNYGLNKANGEWIVFVDSDDYVESTYLEDFFQSQDSLISNTIVIQGLIFDNVNTITYRKYPNAIYQVDNIGNGLIENDLLTFGGPYCKLYNASIIKQNNIKFPLNYSYGEDTIFFLRYLAFVDTLILVSSCNYHYIEWNQESLSRKSHPFEDLRYYVEDNLLAVKKLDERFTSSDILMKSHGVSIGKLLKKMILDVSKLNSSRDERSKKYKEIKTLIRRFSCDYYSKIAAFLLLCPSLMYDFFILVKKGKNF